MHRSRNLMTVMTSCLFGTFLLLLLSRTVSGLGSVVSQNYSYIQIHYTWQEAENFCRNSNGHLITLYTKSEAKALDLVNYRAWIGLYKDGNEKPWSNGWAWTKGGNLYYNPWDDNEPNNGERCGYARYFYDKETAGSADCENYYFFFCDKSDFIPQSMTWNKAEEYCKDKHLAKYDDFNELQSEVDPVDFPVWIGLNRIGGTWKWSAGMSDYRDWADHEPGNNGDCVSISTDKKEMATQDCSHRFPFICSGDNLVLVKENKTWEEALEHCRALRSPTQPELSYELLSVQPEDYNDVRSKVMDANTEEVWTGLRFLAGKWLWVNGADMMYSDLPVCPTMVNHCGTLSKHGTGSMEFRDCAERRNFLCYWM